MEAKITTGLALLTALLTHHLSLAIADHTRASNASTPGGLSLRLISSHEGPGYSTRRGSDGFLYLKHSLSASVANISAAPAGPKLVMIIGTGTAMQEYTLKADFTNRLTWIQCEPCVPHAPQKGPIFSPNGKHVYSKSYMPLAAIDKDCKPEHGMERAGGRCAFHIAGPGGLSVHGYVAREHVVNVNTGTTSPDYIFGCTHSTENFHSGGVFAGVATVTRAPASLAMQLAARGLTRFSYCVTGGTSRHGFLRFGTDVPRNRRYQTTTMLPMLNGNGNDSAAYYVGVVGISLGARKLDMIHPETFARGKDGQGGTVVDLGTPVTVMAEEAYRVVEEAAWSELKEHGAERVERHGYGLCVRVTKAVKGHLPSLSLHFAEEEEATLVISPEQLFLMMDDEGAGQIACLAMVPGRRTVIGALQQVDTRFVFDLKDSKILFAPESCIQDTVVPDV